MCLVAKTKRGVEELKELGWASVCHSHEHKWPVVINRKHVSNTNSSSSSSRSTMSLCNVTNKPPIYHQASLPAVVLTSTDGSLARRKPLLKKYVTMEESVIGQVIVEDQSSDVFEEDRCPQGAAISTSEQSAKRNGNVSHRPLSLMMSYSVK